MKFAVIAIFLLMTAINAYCDDEISANPSNCEKGYCTHIDCEQGFCDGWKGMYEIDHGASNPSGATKANFYFRNETGKTAFNVKILINFKDFFGKHITRVALNDEGPISVHTGKTTLIPKDTSKITFDIYWSDEYLPAMQTKKPKEGATD